MNNREAWFVVATVDGQDLDWWGPYGSAAEAGQDLDWWGPYGSAAEARAADKHSDGRTQIVGFTRGGWTPLKP